MKTTMANLLSSHYDEFKEMCWDNERVISEARTDEDWLNDLCITALTKYGDEEIEEQEGLDYLRKNLLMALKFKWKKIDTRTVYMDDLKDTLNIKQ